MIPVIIGEITSWSNYGSRHTILALITVSALTGALLMLRPDFWLQVINASLIWVGIVSGRSDWGGGRSSEWLTKLQLSAGRVVVGKLFAILVIGGYHLLIILPGIVLMAGLWGMPWNYILLVVLTGLTGLITAAFLAGFPLHFKLEDPEILIFLLIGGWLSLTLAIPAFRIINPLFQIWLITTTGTFPWDGFLGNLGFLAVLVLIETLWLSWEAKIDGE